MKNQFRILASLLFLASAFISIGQPTPNVLKNPWSTNLSGTPVYGVNNLSITNQSQHRWNFYGTNAETVARLLDVTNSVSGSYVKMLNGSSTNQILINPTNSNPVSSNATFYPVAGTNIGLTVFGDAKGSNFWDKSSVKYWGAKGDGITDDSAAFRSAISNGAVSVPLGTYLVSNLTNYSSTFIAGLGYGSVLQITGCGIVQGSDIAVANLTIKGNSSSTGIIASTIYNGTFSGLNVDTHSYGVIFDGLSGLPSNHVSISSSLIRNCAVGFSSGPGYGGGEYSSVLGCTINSNRLGMLVHCGNLIVQGNHIDNNDMGFVIQDAGNGGHSIWSGNTINHNAGSPSLITNVQYSLTFVGNELWYNDLNVTNCAIRFLNNACGSTLKIVNPVGVQAAISGNYFPLIYPNLGDSLVGQNIGSSSPAQSYLHSTNILNTRQPLRIDSSGAINALVVHTNANVGIGTAIPERKLTVSSASIPGIQFENTANNTAFMFYNWSSLGTNPVGRKFVFYDDTSNLDRMVMDSDGNFGINDISPGAKLSVVGNAAIGYTTGTTGPVNGLTINGRVGIGTNAPTAKLEVYGLIQGAYGSATCSTGIVTVATSASTNLFTKFNYAKTYATISMATNTTFVMANAGDVLISFGARIGGSNGNTVSLHCYTNGVHCGLAMINFTATATALDESGFKQFVVNLPAAATIDLRVSNTAAANTTVDQVCFNVMGPN